MPRSNPDALPAGSMLHWYRVDTVLGQGGFGLTYLATDTNLRQRVALKEYLPVEFATRLPDGSVLARSEQAEERYAWGLERFVSEAQVLARFDHPNIVRVHSVFEHNNTAYMVMRYEEGENLEQLLRTGRQPDEDELLGLLLPILDGLEAIHDEGFIHRDIKPDNIYIRRDGSPVLIDFGSARQPAGSTRMLTILVAPGYAPFEQYYDGPNQQGPWTDIYSLGATLYRAVTGRPPVDAIARSRGVLGSTRDVMVPAVEAGRDRYSPRFLAAIDHALRFNERDRPQSIAEWRRDFLDPGSGVSGRPPTTIRPPPSDGDPAERSTQRAAPVVLAADGRTQTRVSVIRLLLVGACGIALGFAAAQLAAPGGDAPTPPLPGAAGAPDLSEQRATIDSFRAELTAKQATLDDRAKVLEEQAGILQAERQELAARRAEAERAATEVQINAERQAEREVTQQARGTQLDAEAERLAGEAQRLAEEEQRIAGQRQQLSEEQQRLAADRQQLAREQQERIRERQAIAEENRRLALLEKRLRDERPPRRAGSGAAPAPDPPPAQVSAAPTPSLDGAQAALRAGHETQARGQFAALAAQGDVQALYRLGVMQLEGRGGPLSVEDGKASLERAAKAGHAGASRRLGEDAEERKDLAAAARWYGQAAVLKDAVAQWRLGEMHAQGRGVGKDEWLGYRWLWAAVQNGSRGAAARMKELETRLQSVEVDDARESARPYVEER